MRLALEIKRNDPRMERPPSFRAPSYQLCDITDARIRTLLSSAELLPRCDVRHSCQHKPKNSSKAFFVCLTLSLQTLTGWYSAQTLEEVRKLVKTILSEYAGVMEELL
jgi:hypothetical protein